MIGLRLNFQIFFQKPVYVVVDVSFLAHLNQFSRGEKVH